MYFDVYKLMKKVIAGLLLVLLCVACKSSKHDEGYIPAAPDYADTTMWYTVDDDASGTGADVFYVISTWETDWMHEGLVCHYADVWNPEHRAHMAIEMRGVADYMAPGNRFFSPYYRHTAIDTWCSQDEELIHRRTRLSMKDVIDAFDYFIAHRDNSRPLVIAGFSQGGMAMIELLKHMSDDTFSDLAVAYIMGYKITPQDTLSSHVRPARGADDVHVAVCYNTVKDVKYLIPVISASCAGINPVNWHTDASPAILSDTISVTLDTITHLCVVEGYDGNEYKPYRDFINQGDIHGCEPWLYKDCIRQNMLNRVQRLKEQ